VLASRTTTYLFQLLGLGGGLIVAKSSVMLLTDPLLTTNIVSATVQDSRCGTSWSVTGVYGPQDDLGKNVLKGVEKLEKLC
jgi:hypothetical protein